MLYVAYQKQAHSAKVEGTGHISHAETGAWPAVGRYGCGNPGRMDKPYCEGVVECIRER